jgi:biotin synthase-like enzyme
MNDKRMAKELVEKGQIIEAGFAGLRAMAIPVDAPQEQIEDMRMAFFAGAQYLFSSILTMLDPEEEPTEADLEMMSNIHEEMERFGKEYELRAMPTGRKQ